MSKMKERDFIAVSFFSFTEEKSADGPDQTCPLTGSTTQADPTPPVLPWYRHTCGPERGSGAFAPSPQAAPPSAPCVRLPLVASGESYVKPVLAERLLSSCGAVRRDGL